MNRLVILLLLAIVSAPVVSARDVTELVPASQSRLVLQGWSNVAPWRCSGTTLGGRMAVAVPLQRINHLIDRIEDGNVARLDASTARFPQPEFQLKVPIDTLRCGNRQMERDMFRALRADAHPVIEFRFAQLIGGVNHDIDNATYKAKIAGVLMLAGTRRNVTLEIEATRVARDRFRFRARLPLRMTDFRITPPTALFGMVKAKDDLIVQFDLYLQEEVQS